MLKTMYRYRYIVIIQLLLVFFIGSNKYSDTIEIETIGYGVNESEAVLELNESDLNDFKMYVAIYSTLDVQ
jgi:hypothetical protein